MCKFTLMACAEPGELGSGPLPPQQGGKRVCLPENPHCFSRNVTCPQLPSSPLIVLNILPALSRNNLPQPCFRTGSLSAESFRALPRVVSRGPGFAPGQCAPRICILNPSRTDMFFMAMENEYAPASPAPETDRYSLGMGGGRAGPSLLAH